MELVAVGLVFILRRLSQFSFYALLDEERPGILPGFYEGFAIPHRTFT
jgi:hypothetical protein